MTLSLKSLGKQKQSDRNSLILPPTVVRTSVTTPDCLLCPQQWTQCPYHYLRLSPPLYFGSHPPSGLVKDFTSAIFHSVLHYCPLSPGSFVLLSLDAMSPSLIFLALHSPLNSSCLCNILDITKHVKHYMVNIELLMSPLRPVPVPVLSISVNGTTIHPVTQTKNLQVIFDFSLSFASTSNQQDLWALPLEFISIESTTL